MIVVPVLDGVTTTEFGGMAVTILKFGGYLDDDVSTTL